MVRKNCAFGIGLIGFGVGVLFSLVVGSDFFQVIVGIVALVLGFLLLRS